MKKLTIVLGMILGLNSCAQGPGWPQSEPQMASRSICVSPSAPPLPIEFLPDGSLAEVSFDVGRATNEEIAVLRRRLTDNGLAVWDDIIMTKRGAMLVASGKGNGILKTQAMADRLFVAICGLEQDKSRLVSLRYTPASELTEVF